MSNPHNSYRILFVSYDMVLIPHILENKMSKQTKIIYFPRLHISGYLLYKMSYMLTDKMPDIFHIRPSLLLRLSLPY